MPSTTTNHSPALADLTAAALDTGPPASDREPSTNGLEHHDLPLGSPGDGEQSAVETETDPAVKHHVQQVHRRSHPARHTPEDDSAFNATALQLAPLLLAVAVAVSVVVYGIRQDGWAAAAGLVAAAVAGLGLGWYRVRQGQTTPERSNPRLHGDLAHWWNVLDARVEGWCVERDDAVNPSLDPPSIRAACDEAVSQRDAVAGILGIDDPSHSPLPARRRSAGPRWVSGAGFVEVFERLHRAEENLLLAAPEREVVAAGLTDELRLVGSPIHNRRRLLAKLRIALTALDGLAYVGLPAKGDSTSKNGNGAAGGGTNGAGGEGAENEETEKLQLDRGQARLVLRDVRRAINEFRDSRRDGLVRTRTNLSWTGLLTGVTAFALLALAMVADAAHQTIYSAIALFLVGAAVGLFNHLSIGAESDGANTEEDFGLTRARLVNAPILSGLAALGGVFLAGIAVGALGPGELAAAAAEGADGVTLTIPNIERIFDLRENPLPIAIAALFGLTPRLLTDRLQSEADSYRDDLRRTSTQEGEKESEDDGS